jgi:hypothetical protein
MQRKFGRRIGRVRSYEIRRTSCWLGNNTDPRLQHSGFLTQRSSARHSMWQPRLAAIAVVAVNNPLPQYKIIFEPFEALVEICANTFRKQNFSLIFSITAANASP